MKKLSNLFSLLFLISFAAFAQDKSRSIYDGEHRIYYSAVAEAEERLVEYIEANKGLSTFPSKLFSDLILSDERCFDYDFSKLIDASHKSTVRSLRVMTSDDGILRLYTWDADGGTMSCYTGITSYKKGNEVFSFASLIGREFEQGGYESNQYTEIGVIACGALMIYTLQKYDGKPVYVVLSHSSGSTLLQSYHLGAFEIADEGIKTCDIFPDNSSYSYTISWSYDPSFGCGKDTGINGNQLRIPETRPHWNKYAAALVTGRDYVYLFDGEKFKFQQMAYPDNLYGALRNYKYNIIIAEISPWLIRIDKMPNGAIRYASWKNRNANEKPDIVIDNGICVSSEVRDERNELVKINEKYVFQNHDYFYEVSWVCEGSAIYPGQLLVRHNDEVLMIR